MSLYGTNITPVWLGIYLSLFNTVVFIILLIERKGRYPEKSYKNVAINLALYPLRLLKIGPFKGGALTFDNALIYAEKKTGLTDFGEKETNSKFAEIYRTTLDLPTQKKQNYTNLGYISARIELNMTMVRRLRFVQYLKDVPSVTKINVPSPVFVMGLPRTGTTLLHRLLSLDPQVKAPLMWELMAPVPDNSVRADNMEKMEQDRSKRARYVKKLMKTRRSMGDKALEHIHEVDWNLPEECFLALADEIPLLVQYFYGSYMHPDISKELYRSNAVNAYAHYKKYLQLLSYQTGEAINPRRYMLKCPVHLFYVKEIAKVFPDAKIVWTHRHPISAVPSMCSLLKSLHQLYYENEGRDDSELGKTLLKVSEDLLKQAPQDIIDSKLPCSNVLYNELVKDPIQAVKNIYLQFGWNFTSEYEGILKTHLEDDQEKRAEVKRKNAKNGTILHTYTPQEFGITEKELSSGGYADYIQKYKIPMSKN
jgi:hypothetical protein